MQRAVRGGWWMAAGLALTLGGCSCPGPTPVDDAGIIEGDAGTIDTDAGRPDAATPDSGTPDAGTPDSGTPDAALPDGGQPDDGGPADDGGQSDGGGQLDDGGQVDDGGGLQDGGEPSDAGNDAGAVSDGGEGDAGTPDGGPQVEVVFASNRGGSYQLYGSGRDGTALVQLTAEGQTNTAPTFSPDGTTVAFASTRGGTFALYLLDVATQQVTPVTTGLELATAPSFSPDGTQLCFEGRASGGTSTEIYTVPVTGGEATALTSDPAVDTGPVWASDGRIYFVSDRDGDFEVFAMNDDGTGLTQVTTDSAILGRPAVSPDAAELAYTRGTAVILRTLSSGNEVTLSDNQDSEPAFSPDGTALAVTSLRHGNPEVLIVDAVDGTVLNRVTDDPGVDGAATLRPLP